MTKTILFLLGVALYVAAIVLVIITAKWSITSVLFLLIGTISFILSLWFWGKKQKLWQKRSTQQSINEIVMTTVILAMVSLINIFAVRYNQRWDFTENQVQNLSPLTKAIVEKLEEPLEVLVFDRNINPSLENLLEKYQGINPLFRFKLVDPEEALGMELAREYKIQSLGEIHLLYKEKKQRINVANNVPEQAITETLLTNTIERIRREQNVNIYFLQGHGEASNELVERGLAQLVTKLEEKGNKVLELNLATSGSIPKDANLIIIAGATRKLLTAEVSTLQTYLSSGGSLLLLLSPNIDIGITSLLQEWGVELDNRLVVDGSNSGEAMGFGPGVAIVNNYGNHPITSSFGKGISIFPESRPLKTQEKIGVKSIPLAITNKQTWAENDLKSEEISFDSTKDLSGPLNIAIALEKNLSQVSRMIIFGSSTFATNGWFEQQLNGDILINSINWLLGEDRDILTIQPRDSTNRRINLSSTQVKIINWLSLRIIPALALSISIFLWRKHC